MRLPLALATLVVIVSTPWLFPGPSASGAPGGSLIYLPFVARNAAMEKVAIVQQDGHQAVYWRGDPSVPPNTVDIYLEVQNYSDRSVTGVSVEFRAFDKSGLLISEVVTQTTSLLDVLHPGQTSPLAFDIPFPGGYSAFREATKEFTVLPTWSYTDDDPQRNLQFSSGYPYTPQPTPSLQPTAVPPPRVTPTITPTPTRTPVPSPITALFPADAGLLSEPVSRPSAEPPSVSHTLEGRSACTSCHQVDGPGVGAPGGAGMPASHAGRTDSVCMDCHRGASSASPTPTPTPYVPAPPVIHGWAMNTGVNPATGVSVVVAIRGNEKAFNLVLDAMKVPISGSIPPGGAQFFSANFSRDYGDLYGSTQVVIQGSFQGPGILAAW